MVYPDATAPVHVGPTGDAAARDNARMLGERTPVLGAPAPLNVVLAPGQTGTRTVTIRNTAAPGSRPLDWAVSVLGVGPDAARECAGPVVV